MQFVIARRDDSLTRQSIVSRGRVQTCLFAYGFTVDRHGLRPRDDKMWSESVYRSRTTHHVIARRKRSERHGNPSCLEGGVQTCLFAYGFTVDRHGLSALAITKNIIQPTSMQSTALHLSLQKAQKETSRVAIHSQKIFSFSSIFIP